MRQDETWFETVLADRSGAGAGDMMVVAGGLASGSLHFAACLPATLPVAQLEELTTFSLVFVEYTTTPVILLFSGIVEGGQCLHA